MKKYVKGSNFVPGVFLVNQYGEEVVELIPDDFGYYEVPRGFKLEKLDIGDVYTVEEREHEMD